MFSSAIYLLIPAYEPDEKLLPLVQALAPHYPIIIVNDGSTQPECARIFAQLAALPQITVLQHEVNQGKGAALKTGFAYQLAHAPNSVGVITLDADGQHLVPDVLKVAQQLQKQPAHVILGVRDFGDKVPLRSKFGNTVTGFLFKKIYKLPISDTQTGLRGLPLNLLKSLTKFHTTHYEFEMECLVYFAEHKIPVTQLPISTVYIDHNKSSHFNPILDSVRIYSVLLRFLIISHT